MTLSCADKLLSPNVPLVGYHSIESLFLEGTRSHGLGKNILVLTWYGKVYFLRGVHNWSIVDVTDTSGVKLSSLDFSLYKDIFTQGFFLHCVFYNIIFIL